MNKDEVLKLAKLARIEIGEEEAEKLSHEFDAILGYVAEVKNAIGPTSHEATRDRSDFALRNVMREDVEPHESGIYTEKILQNVPNRNGDYVEVKKILG